MKCTPASAWIYETCPATRQRVIGRMRVATDPETDDTVWWRCPACQSWHVKLRTAANIGPQSELPPICAVTHQNCTVLCEFRVFCICQGRCVVADWLNRDEVCDSGAG